MPVIITNTVKLSAAATNGATSTVCEPSVTQIGQDVLATGNWYAAASRNGGGSWNHLDPYSFFPAAGGGFCCDQTSVTDGARNLTAWVLQYVRDASGNTLRLAANSNGDFENNPWDIYDFTPTSVDPSWTNEWFDYNHVTISESFLYLVSNMFDFNDRFTRCVVFRLSLDDLQAGTLTNYDLFIAPSQYFSLRATEGATNSMYFFAHDSTSRITVFEWPEGAGAPSSFTVNITRWIRGTLFSQTPDGSNWLQRCDGRITGAWCSGDRIAALWTSNAIGIRPHPFIRSVCIDVPSQTRVAEPDLWSSTFALAYPCAGASQSGNVGVTFFYGGSPQFVNHAVGTIDPNTLAPSLRMAVRGTHGPADNKWGDYLSVRPDPTGTGMVASGFTLQGGRTRAFIAPHLTYFN